MNITEVLTVFKSKKALADALGVSPAAVTLWGQKIPEGRKFQIEVITNGKLKAENKKSLSEDCTENLSRDQKVTA